MENKLKQLRLAKNLSQEELCKQIQGYGLYISRSTYSKYETGSRDFSCETLCIFSDFFDISMDEILMKQCKTSDAKAKNFR